MTLRTTLGGLNANISRNIGVLKSELEQTSDVSAAIERLIEARIVGIQLQNMIEDLEFAKNSLHACGYSDKWLESLNVDGKFLDAVSIDMTKLVGSPEAKTDVALEGVWSTIWYYIKKIWDFIYDVVKKVVHFVAQLLQLGKRDMQMADRVEAALRAVAGDKDPTVIARRIGEAINKIEGGSTNVDLRDLVVRCRMCYVMALEICDIDKLNRLCGKNAPDEFTSEFTEYSLNIKDRSVKDTPNIFLKDLIDEIDRGKISNTIGFKDFILQNDVPAKAALEKAGISVYQQGNRAIFSIAPINGTLVEIDYASAYGRIENYDDVRAAWKSVVKQFEDVYKKNIESTIKTFEALAKYSRDMADDIIKANFSTKNAKPKHDAFACFSKWMLEVTAAMSHCLSAYETTNARIRTIESALLRTIADIKNGK